MSTHNDGGPAFPNALAAPTNDGYMSTFGMTLRDYFATKAMQSLIVDPDRADQSREECARLSYLMADAMLAARGAA